MPEREIDPIDTAARIIAQSRYVVALVGAGLSAESGIPTFRGPGGLWTRLGEPGMNGFQEFLRDPARWWRLQQEQQADPVSAEFRAAIERAQPNPGHYALAEMEEIGVLKSLITQNVDNLHFAAGSRQVIEIHGNRTKLRCIGCESRWPRGEFESADLPLACPECGALVKPDTVMFGEPIPNSVLALCFQEASRCDCMIVAGTSATVYPAAGFPLTVKERGGLLIEANPNETDISHHADVVLRGPTGQALPELVKRVRDFMGL